MKKYTICNNNEFSSMYKSGTKIVGKNIVFYYKKNGQTSSRLGIIASKKIGNAVKRNRAKRVIRAAYRESQLPIGYDFVIVARNGATECKSYQIKSFIKFKVLSEL
jgi:ribonuclease P protein component